MALRSPGQLKAPRIAGIKGFDRDMYSHHPIGLQVFGPLVLVNGSRDATALDLDSLTSDFEATGWQDLVRVERRSYSCSATGRSLSITTWMVVTMSPSCIETWQKMDLSVVKRVFRLAAVNGSLHPREPVSGLNGEALYTWVTRIS